MKDKEKNQEFENLKEKLKNIEKENYELRKDNSIAYAAIKQLNREKRSLLQRLTKEIKFRIEFESELMILKEDAEETPF